MIFSLYSGIYAPLSIIIYLSMMYIYLSIANASTSVDSSGDISGGVRGGMREGNSGCSLSREEARDGTLVVPVTARRQDGRPGSF